MANKLKEVQESTILDILDKLEKYGKVLCVRPTGFGKTTMAIQIMDYFENIIVLYPNLNIGYSIMSKTNDESIVFMTYAKLVIDRERLSYKDFIDSYNNDSTVFICDEAHMLGAANTSECMRILQTNCKNARFLGLTATPVRTDGYDIINTFFDGHITFPYTLKDALDDNIFIRPKYVYTLLDQSEIYDRLYNRIHKSNMSITHKMDLTTRLSTLIKSNDIANSNIVDIIRSNIETREYYKFISFCPNIEMLNTKKYELECIFKQVFSGFDINILVISSENSQTRSNLKLLDHLRYRPNTVDLILTVDMLNFGYHVNDLTGILMFRSTQSNIIYTQQIGRVLSVSAKAQTIIFDFVENFSNCIDNISVYGKFIQSVHDVLGLDIFIELQSYIEDILDIDRLIIEYNNEDIYREVISAYKNSLVDKQYCLTKLNIDEFKFDELLEKE